MQKSFSQNKTQLHDKNTEGTRNKRLIPQHNTRVNGGDEGE
jgi:hypothetical protein